VFVPRSSNNYLARARLVATPALDPCDGHFLAGLIEAESTFWIAPNNGTT
jgi:hypothetical protein